MSVDGSTWGDTEGYTMFGESTRKDPDKDKSSSTFDYTNGFSHVLPPTDPYKLIYVSFFMAGVGFLLPYNSFIMAVDYFQSRYPNTTVIFDMSAVYIFTAFFAVLINNFLVEALTLNTRIKFGYIISCTTLLFVAVCEVWWETFGLSVATSYTINLIAVAVVAFGCTVQQSSFYGYSSMLPSPYTQAVMAGESAAGFWVSLNRITSKSLLPGEISNTILFFFMSGVLVGTCFLINMMARETHFVQYYVKLCQDSRTKITLEPTEDSGLMDPLDTGDDTKTQYGFLKLQTSPPPADTATGSNGLSTQTQYSAFSFANPVYEPTTTKRSSVEVAGTPGKFLGEGDGRVRPGEEPVPEEVVGGTKYKVEDIVIRMRPSTTATGTVYVGNGRRLWNGIKRGWWARWEVSRLIWDDMLAISLAYFMTLCLYPGIMSKITSCQYGSWLPVILMALFNGFDLLGKMLSGRPIKWGRMLLPLNGMRVVAVVLSLLVMVNAGPGGELEYCAMVLAVFLGITNGVCGSVPMIIAPGKVPEQHREISGNIMTLSYNVGLTAGSIAAYFLNDFIKFGDPKECPAPMDHLFSTVSPSGTSVNLTTVLATAITTCCATTLNLTQTAAASPASSTLSGITEATILSTVSTLLTTLNITASVTPTMPLAILNINTSIGNSLNLTDD